RRVGSKLWRMASRDRGGSGTRSLTRSKRRSSIWPLRSRTCRRVSSPSTSRTHRAALCQKPLFIGHGLITSPAFILMKAADRFANPTTAPNQLWQIDFTYLKVIGWGWFYLSIVLDDFSRFILAWKLCTTMSATDVSDTLQVALRGSGLNQVKVLHRPRLLSDNGPSYVSSELGKWLEDNGIGHIRGRPYHPMTQGKIERYHRSMKNRILLDNYYLPGQLEHSIEQFVSYYATTTNDDTTGAWTNSRHLT